MIFEKYVMPNLMVTSYDQVTPELLIARGIRYLICDIDNTLVTYDDPEPTGALLDWFRRMNEGGIKVAFVSNNRQGRVDVFNRNLGFSAYGKGKKPFIGKIRRAMRDMGAVAGNTALIGDQLLTDAAAARLAGIYSIIVPPIKDRASVFFKLKRRFERPYIRKYNRMYEKDISGPSGR